MSNKVNYEQALMMCNLVFTSEDYNDFLSVIERDTNEKIKKIDLSPVKNYTHSNMVLDYNKELLALLYQHIYYYLEQRNMYTPKIREGMALCASKAAIIGSTSFNRIVGYIDLGDKESLSDRCNPFEEISRMLLLTLRENPMLDFYVEHQTDPNASARETKIFYETIKTSLSKEKSKSIYEHYAKGDVSELIGRDLEKSNVDSKNPLSATKKENGELLNTQFDRIYDLYQTNIELQVVVGKIPLGSFQEQYLSRFQTKLIKAKRNIGIYQKTKKLSK